MDRMILQKKLVDILGENHVYYQPPASLRLSYPAIVYKLTDRSVEYASNHPYANFLQYNVTVISEDPDNVIGSDLMTQLKWCSFNGRNTVENLYHDRFTLYF